MDGMREQVDRIVDRIKEFEAKEIILFGSQVEGKADEGSDIDLCVITEKSKKRKIHVLRELRRAIAPVLTYPLDLLVYDKDEFYKRASVSSSFEHKIKTEGVKIYEQ